ncbi:hypothetical protein EDP2_825 [Enterobacter cloacae S611]|uniref:Uncharacterized protein n=1 Tax=Enterobacter cloacae S611 TaxID=1399146 RepID=A0ABP2ZLR2_ENTCL|nr:hypothetical protein [Kosakonia sp. HypNH10]ESS57324.1 hypothetical protein EDP2_825 [Enterobacter cloacae S611]MDH2914173.1 hypothetical protein [Kosakonia sp. HypNH10]
MKSKFYSQRHNVGQHIPRDKLYVGMLIHLSYTNFGCVWCIAAIETPNANGEIWLKLVAPRSGKAKRSNSIYATYIRNNEPIRRS